jgi:beta-galactosidase
VLLTHLDCNSDIAGFEKDRAYWHKIWLQNGTTAPLVHLFPHWNWAVEDRPHSSDKEGAAGGDSHLAACDGLCQLLPEEGSGEEKWRRQQERQQLLRPANVTVFAWSNAGGGVELLLNNRSLGVQTFDTGGWGKWIVSYEPGTLTARAYDTQNTTVVEKSVTTTGPPAALRASIKDGVGAAGVVMGGRGVGLIKIEVSKNAIYTLKRTFYQDRLGTNIGKLKKGDRFSSGGRCERPDDPDGV